MAKHTPSGDGKNVFNQVLVEKPNYSWFDLSHDHKLTFNMGELIPVLVQECLPSDKFVINSEALLRFQPMVAPIMHKVDIFLHHFFVPNRILWPNWEKFITGSGNALTPVPTYTPPYLAENLTVPISSLGDYLGFPIGDWGATLGVDAYASAIPFAAYQMIWFEYFRDQNLQEPDMLSFHDWIKMNDGEQDFSQASRLLALRRRAWEHDFFTSCLPFAQKGEQVNLPIELTVGVDIPVNYVPTGDPAYLLNLDGSAPGISGDLSTDTSSGAFSIAPSPTLYNYDPNGTLRAQGDSSDIATTTSINDLRAAYALQKWLEKNARGGTRYTESLLAHFGVHSSDARLQRPEYLGGSRSIMAISEVLQTSASTLTETPQGNMAGHGVSVMGSNQVNYFCEEHGFIISLLSVRPKTAYHQGVPRFFQKDDRFKYFWSEFAMIGEEAVKNKEIYYQNVSGGGTNEDTFGYLPRYSEYRYNPSRVSGDFHTTLEYWALHRTFNVPPALDDTFIECKPSNRIFAVDPAVAGVNTIIGHVFHQMSARRPLPKYGNPGGLI